LCCSTTILIRGSPLIVERKMDLFWQICRGEFCMCYSYCIEMCTYNYTVAIRSNTHQLLTVQPSEANDLELPNLQCKLQNNAC
jgi:hypothetical protein